MFYTRSIGFKKQSPPIGRAFEKRTAMSLLPCALLVAVRLEALPAFVLRHLQTTFLLKVAHGESG